LPKKQTLVGPTRSSVKFPRQQPKKPTFTPSERRGIHSWKTVSDRRPTCPACLLLFAVANLDDPLMAGCLSSSLSPLLLPLFLWQHFRRPSRGHDAEPQSWVGTTKSRATTSLPLLPPSSVGRMDTSRWGLLNPTATPGVIYYRRARM